MTLPELIRQDPKDAHIRAVGELLKLPRHEDKQVKERTVFDLLFSIKLDFWLN